MNPALSGSPESLYLGYSQQLADELLGRIRTDLDSFNEAEMRVLENSGYWAAERSSRRHDPRLVPSVSTAAATPYPEWVEETMVRRELQDSHKRFSLRRLRSS